MNQRKLTSLLVWCVSLSIAFSGCVYVGADPSRANLNEETASKIIPGKTTREEVLKMLGPPDEILSNGDQFTYMRKYEMALLSPGGLGSGKPSGPANRYVLKVDFDKQGIVSRRDFTAPYEFHDKPVLGVPPYRPIPSYR